MYPCSDSERPLQNEQTNKTSMDDYIVLVSKLEGCYEMPAKIKQLISK